MIVSIIKTKILKSRNKAYQFKEKIHYTELNIKIKY